MAEHIDPAAPDDDGVPRGLDGLDAPDDATDDFAAHFALSAFSWRVRLLGVVMAVALAAVSGLIWQSPSARRAVADAVPLPQAVDRALRPAAEPAAPKPKRDVRSPDEIALAQLRAQVSALTDRLRAGRMAQAAQTGAQLGAYLRTARRGAGRWQPPD
jgi:hypothetical protein